MLTLDLSEAKSSLQGDDLAHNSEDEGRSVTETWRLASLATHVEFEDDSDDDLSWYRSRVQGSILRLIQSNGQ